MAIEFEAKILDISVPVIKARLKKLGAKKVSERNMRRYVYDIIPGNKGKWIRLRDDGEKITLTVKEIHDDSRIDGTEELEVEVGDFDTTNQILNALGFFHKAYQENRRTSYLLGNTHVEIDFWPKIPPYVEVEGSSKAEVERTVKSLGFALSETTSINTYDVYKKYGIDIHGTKELKF